MLQLPLYLVGGVVRDIFLGHPIKEFDLVVEGDSAKFAEYIVKKIGGRVLIHSRFGTATWILNESTLKRLNFPILDIADFSLSFDLISARAETYSSPGVLPTVKRSTIDDDLRRRDFTVNAMAIRLDGDHFGELLDPLDGQKDLEQKLVRVLHNKSFIDDPTRMFRAVRYSIRYGFELEPETLKLFNDEAKSVLSELSGERLRHEFDLAFNETESISVLGTLQEFGLVAIIHSALPKADQGWLIKIEDKPAEGFGEFAVPDILSFKQTMAWALFLMNLSEKEIEEIAERLDFPALLTKAALTASSLYTALPSFKDWAPSQWTFHLDEIPSLAVYAVWLATSERSLRTYLEKWQNIRPITTGDDLKQVGLTPGPKYKEILSRLRAAWLDGEVKTQEEEVVLRDRLIAE
jgi:tRNA nucleotidyltransferase (CCA-adding enzyme)